MVMRETWERIKHNNLNNEEEVDVRTIDISWLSNDTRGIKDFCKKFEKDIKSPEVKSSDFITQVVAILWQQYRPLIMYLVVIPNISYAFLLIFYLCYYLEGPMGGEMTTS